MDIAPPRDKLKRLRYHLEKLTEDNQLNNLDQQYQGLVAHLQEKISINRQTSHDISTESKKLEILPSTAVKLEASKLFGDKSDLRMEAGTFAPSEEHSTFLNDCMIASRQQLKDRVGEKQIRNVRECIDVFGDVSELWQLLKNREVSTYQDDYRNIIFIDSNNQRVRKAYGKIVEIHNENYLDVKIEVNFYPNYRLLNRNTGSSRSYKLYAKSDFIYKFQEINPPLSLQEVKTLQEVKDRKDKLEAYKKQREIESHKKQELRIKTNILLEDLENIFEQDFDSSDFFYNLKCSQYISFESYKTQKLDFLKRKKKEELLGNLEKLLIKYLFIEADELYQSQCKNYINLHEYETKKQPFLKEKKNLLLLELDRIFISSFREADIFYSHRCEKYICQEDYDIRKQKFVQSWIENNLDNKPDLEQTTAIGKVSSHVQVIARAGSGKTSTLVNRAIFLQKHCGVKPSEILILAFNKKAAQEIRNRLQQKLQNDTPYAMTFHALAYALVRPSRTLIYDETGGQQLQSHLIQSVIHDHLRNRVYQNRMRSLMIKKFKAAWKQIVKGEYTLTPQERLTYRRTNPQTGVDGVTYKSGGEKIIADFLFEHDIPFIYERNFWWGVGENRINYHPDFTIIKKVSNRKGIVIEYFGMQGDPNYDAQSERKRQYWQDQSNYFFLEINPSILKYGRKALETHLQESLRKIGLQFTRLSEEQLWAKIEKRAKNRFDQAMTNFIGRCRKKCWSPDRLSAEIAKRDFNPNSDIDNIEREFLHLAEDFYVAYLESLRQRNEEDFDGLMQESSQTVNDGKTVFANKDMHGDLRDIKYIMIDEYQDFSMLFDNLMTAIRNQNPEALFFCVGDDWQAINRFAGSDLYYYSNFTNIFKESHKLSVTTNYRSASQIVEIGNKLMINKGVTAKSFIELKGKIQLVDTAKFKMTTIEERDHKFNLNAIAIRLLYKLIKQGKEIILLSHYNDLQNAGYRIRIKDGVEYLDKRTEIEEFRKSILDKLKLTDEEKKRVDISTTHKYKGKEKQVVIVLDADRYGNIHPDFIFNRIFGDDVDDIFEDERRLFYVALTRAKEELFIITDSFNLSPFITGLNETMCLKEISWEDYPVPESEDRYVIVKVENQQGKGTNGTYNISESLNAYSYEYRSDSVCWVKIETSKRFLAKDSRLQFILQSDWSCQANGIEVNFYNEQEKILASYLANNGRWTCNFDHFNQSNPDEYDYTDVPF
ncbi:UvrD-helicase domain-containing protein [Pseudanabaena yagii]|uniref:DNA 3'-5' helicase n=1 Tax=Pseudanabaena yagii GIHE-NHR1 TaxID=2722753 RepID=A0ABX1M217_9CYAN|nr:UvrD-helicase domain-containing protein [Pseudanabaena yagii]NMF61079.1 UvrD-helicase domain-containing protein [Pseudanabaena yagii GIHE-NHR1]